MRKKKKMVVPLQECDLQLLSYFRSKSDGTTHESCVQ